MQSRDDFFALIHKALRRELFSLTAEAAAADWTSDSVVRPLCERWRRLDELLRDHSDHEDRHFFALAERKAPGATAALTEQHSVLDRALDVVEHTLSDAEDGDGGDLVHRRMAAFVADYLPHLELEERHVMPLLWATCSDDELAATRNQFMADVPPPVAAFSLRLMLPAVTPHERADLVGRIRATAPPPVVDEALEVAALVLAPEIHARLLADLAA
jgi:hemerythrin-like domain-containing protein